MNDTIKIVATKRTCKGWKEDEYDIKIESESYIYLNKGNNVFVFRCRPYGNNIEKRIKVYNDKGIWNLSDRDHYTKKLLLKIISQIKEFIKVTLTFDENEFTDSKLWNIDISKQITVKVLRPIGMQIMGSTVVKGEVFTTIPKKRDSVVCQNNDRYAVYKDKWYSNIYDLVIVLFYDLDILGAEVHIDGKKVSALEAEKLHTWNVNLIEIFL